MLLSRTPARGSGSGFWVRLSLERAHLDLRTQCQEGGSGLCNGCSSEKASYIFWNVLCAHFNSCPFCKL